MSGGEEEKFDKTPTCKNRKIWFDTGELLRPQFIFPDVYWKRTSVPYNVDRIAIDKQLYAFVPKLETKEGEMLLGGIMNSDANALMREMYGRTVGGLGLNRNQVMVWEAEEMPVIDPRTIEGLSKERVIIAFQNLLEKCRTSNELEVKQLEHALNSAVMGAIGLDHLTDELEREVERLIDVRVGGGGERKEVMVESESGEESRVLVTPLKGARVVQKSSSLDKFMNQTEA